uniref:Sodium/potassium/calcium exchanger 1 n=1 Tax=Canis lupus dingo TaxID=286419 RepID=A0A8C0K7A0_CANLU
MLIIGSTYQHLRSPWGLPSLWAAVSSQHPVKLASRDLPNNEMMMVSSDPPRASSEMEGDTLVPQATVGRGESTVENTPNPPRRTANITPTIPKNNYSPTEAETERRKEDTTTTPRRVLNHYTPTSSRPTVKNYTPTTPPKGEIQSYHPTQAEYPPDLFSIEERRQGWVVLHIFGMMYVFVALAIVCDEFFVPALGVITDKLQISDDVAGATFMAAGGSAPELFTSLIGVFISHSNVGIGTIVGSAVFNILFVIGTCALFSREILNLTWWPLFRDVSFYILDLMMLILFFLDSLIAWWESLLLLLAYAFYVFTMKWNKQLEIWVKEQLSKRPVAKVMSQGRLPLGGDLPAVLPAVLTRGSSSASLHNSTIRSTIYQLMLHSLDPLGEGKQGLPGPAWSPVHPFPPAAGQEQGPAKLGGSGEDEATLGRKESNSHFSNFIDKETQEANEEPLSLEWPETRQKQAIYLFLLPIVFPLWLTVPDVRRLESRKFFVVTFLGSIVWIAMFSYLMVWWAHQVGETVGISEEIMGLTILAAGTSIPDLITSVIVARKGLGDMAVSSSVGSNIFDITVGLPVPWLLFSLLNGLQPVPVSSNGLFCAIVLLFLMLLFVISSIASCKWRMNKILGFTMFLLYFVFLIISVMLEDRIISCPVSV